MLYTREAHLRLGAQSFYWGAGTPCIAWAKIPDSQKKSMNHIVSTV